MNQIKQPGEFSPPQQLNTDATELLDLRHLFDVVMLHKWSILGLAFVVSLAAGFWVYSPGAGLSGYCLHRVGKFAG